MLISEFENRLIEQIEERMTSSEFEIVTLSVVGPKNSPVLRVYIDTEGGVSFEELAKAQGIINPIIEEIDPFVGAYTLEVSSPGIDRPLRKLDDFDRFDGKKVHLRIQHPVSDRRNFNGILRGIEGNNVKVEAEGELFELDFDSIQRANLIGEI